MLLSYLKAGKFVWLARNLQFQLKRIAFWNDKKTGKYDKMIADHGAHGWKLKCIVAEVGCRGYIPPSLEKRSNTLDSPQRN